MVRMEIKFQILVENIERAKNIHDALLLQAVGIEEKVSMHTNIDEDFVTEESTD